MIKKVLLISFLLTSFAFMANAQLFTNYTTSNSSLSNNNILCTYGDAQGNVWFGTSGSGVCRFNGTSWATYTTSSGLGSNIVRDITQDQSGNMWFATENGLTKKVGSTWTNYTASQLGTGSNNIVLSVHCDAAGTIWTGVQFNGILKQNGSSWTKYSTSNTSIPHNFVNDITHDLNNNIWIATSDGVAKHNSGTSWTAYTSANSLGIYSDEVLSCACDSNGAIWFGSRPGAGLGGGVNKYANGVWSYYKTTQGLAHNEVQSIACDNENVWFGALNIGITKYSTLNSNFQIFYTSNGLVNANVREIDIDASGNIWFGTAGGASKMKNFGYLSATHTDITCGQQGTGSISISASGLSTLYYSIDNGTTFQASNTFTGLNTGSYILAVTDSNSTENNVDTIVVGSIAVGTINLGNDMGMCENDSIQINGPSGYSSYSWIPANLVSNSSIRNPYLLATADTIYHLFVTDANGCIITDSVGVNITAAPPVPIVTVNSDSFLAPPGFVSYQWYRYETAIWGATFQLFLPFQPGIYYLEVENIDACKTKSGMNHFQNPSIEDFNLINQSPLFPNPSEGEISLELPKGDYHSVIYDINGHIFSQEDFSIHQNKSTHSFNNDEQLAKGIYFLLIENSEMRVVKKFVLQ